MRKHCGNCANHRKETNQFSEACSKCVAAVLENGEKTAPSHWKAKPMTNEDIIRNMTSKELAGFIANVARNGWTRWILTSPQEWLQQPAEGE